jgi:hypothetical protein
MDGPVLKKYGIRFFGCQNKSYSCFVIPEDE